MSAESTDFDLDTLVDLVGEAEGHVQQFKEAIVEGDTDSDVVELAEDLWEVLDEIEDVLDTIDLEEVPEAIDVEELPEAVDIEDVPEGLFDEDETAIELTSVKEAVDLRELWDAVNLTDLYSEKQELEEEVDEATDHVDSDEDGLLGDHVDDDEGGLLGSDEEEDGMFEDVLDMGGGADLKFDAETRQAIIEEKIQDAVVKFREMLLATHEKLEKLYRMNQQKLGQPGRQPDSLNPTAVSTLPSGPVPESPSLRASTVPSQVRYSRVENPRRIYAHRFREATADEPDEGDESQEDTASAAGDHEDPDEERTSERDDGEQRPEDRGDEEIVIEVHDE